jgi:hypothetical protein
MGDTTAILQRERATLDWLRVQAGNLRIAPNGLYAAIDNALLRMKNLVGMNVFLCWPVPHDSGFGDLLWVYVGGVIEIDEDKISQLSYCLCVAKDTTDNQPRRILRKYHFDYANPALKRRTPQPIFHLQYPGRIPPAMPGPLDDTHQDPALDEPRIFFVPMSLAMVLHIAFREFPDEFGERIRKDGYWLNILRDNQKALLEPFFQKCDGLIKAKRVVMDAMYEE